MSARSVVIMNRYLKGILIIGGSVIILMLLFPPFHVVYQSGIEIDKGYAFILNPPTFWGRIESTVDVGRLTMQVTGAALLCAVVYLMAHAYKK